MRSLDRTDCPKPFRCRDCRDGDPLRPRGQAMNLPPNRDRGDPVADRAARSGP
jgi:hypothetical protein